MSFKRRKIKVWLSCFVVCFFLLVTLVGSPLFAYHTGAGDMHGGTSFPDTVPDPDKGDGDPDYCSVTNCGQDGEPVSLTNGEFLYTEDVLFIPCRGLNIQINHTYRSRRNFNGRWGFGWFFSYDIKLKKLENNNLLLLDGTGRKDEFVYNSVDDSYTPPPGFYETLQENTDGTYTRTLRHGKKQHFDVNGCLTKIEDRNGNSLTFNYDPSGKLPITGKSAFFVSQTEGIIANDYKLTQITDPVGRQINLSYNAKGRLLTIIDWTGRTITYGYDENDNLTSITSPATTDYPAGLTTTYAYYDNHNLKSIIDPKNQKYLTNVYDHQDLISNQTYGSGLFIFTYDPDNSKVTVVNRKGYKTDYFLNDIGNITQKIVYTAEPKLRVTDPDSYITNYEYNNNMEITRITYPRRNSVEYTYDEANADPKARGNLLEIRRKPLSGSSGVADIVTTFTYEPRFNFIKTITDPRGNVTTYTYDYEDSGYATENGNLMKVSYPSEGSQTIETNFTYNSHGQMETVADPNANVTKYEYYSATGYLWKIINGFDVLNYTTEMTYDSVGNMTSLKNPREYTTIVTYNSLNKFTQTTATTPFNYVTKYSYDENGKLKQLDRQSGDVGNPWITTTYTYNNLDKLTTITDELGNVTTFGYDNNENRTSITDAEGKMTSYEYDERDLLWKVTDAGSHVTEYTYNFNGSLQTIKDARGNETNYSYDDFDRLQTTTYANTTTESYEYDPADNLTKKTNQKSQQIVYAYDELNRLDLKIYPDSSTVDYAYDVGSRLTSVIDSNGTISYSFDEVNRIKSVTYPGSKVVSYEYDSSGNRTKLTYPDADYITVVYDELNRLDQIKNATAQIIADYTYNDLSRRTQLNYLNGTQSIYSYDAIGRLASLDNKVITPETLISGFSYDYDNSGNRKYVIFGHDSDKGDVYTYDNIYQLTNVKYSVVDPVSESATTGSSTFDSQMTYNFDNLGNRTSTVDGGTTTYIANNMNQYTDVGGTTHTYDNNGNLASDGTNTYQYDYENRLTQITTPSATITFKYDAFGRRIEKNVSGQITKFIYDGDQVIMETDNAGNSTAKYIYGTDIDEILTMNRSGNTYYYHFDSLGSAANISDSSGSKVESYSYDVYGEASIKDGTGTPLTETAVGNPYIFTGRRYDNESELYFYRARYYDQKIGRFLQTDPLGYWDGMNLYEYLLNNPVNGTDPYGLLKPKGSFPLYSKKDFDQGVEELSKEIQKRNPSVSKEMADKAAREIMKEMTISEASQINKNKNNDDNTNEEIIKKICERAGIDYTESDDQKNNGCGK